MGILEIRKMTEKKGCGIAVMVVMGLVGLGLVGTGLFSWYGQDSGQNTSQVAFVVSGRNVTAEEYAEQVSQAQQDPNMMLQLQFGGPAAQLQIIGNVLDGMIRQSLVKTLAAQNNVKVSEEDARKAWETQVETEIQSTRTNLVSSDPSLATDAAKLDAAFKAQTGQTPAEMRQRAMEEFGKELKGEQRQELLESFTGPVLLEHFAAKSKKTEADVKASFDTYFLNRLALTVGEKPEAEVQAAAVEAREALVGGTPFAEVYKKYVPGSDTVPTPNESTRLQLEANPTLKPLLSLEQGQVSQPIQELGSWVVYQVVKIENKLPATFETDKQRLLVDARRNDAAQVLQDKIDGLLETAVEWKSPALEVAYKTYTALTTQANDVTKAELREMADEAEAAMGDSIVGSNPAMIAKYAALNVLVSRSTESEKKELLTEWIDIHTQVLADMENPSLRLALADLYFEAGEGELAAATLKEAVENSTVADPMAEFTIGEVETRLKDKAKADKLPAELKTEIEALIAQWRKDLAAFQKEQEEIQKEEEKMMEEMNKEMEEQLKKEGGSATTGTTGSTTTPESSTTGGDKPAGQ